MTAEEILRWLEGLWKDQKTVYELSHADQLDKAHIKSDTLMALGELMGATMRAKSLVARDIKNKEKANGNQEQPQ